MIVAQYAVNNHLFSLTTVNTLGEAESDEEDSNDEELDEEDSDDDLRTFC